MWYRRCQECGKVGVYKPVPEYKGDSWRDVKCRQCKSQALDYGSEQDPSKPADTSWMDEED